MRFSQFCDTAENTEDEQQLLEFFKDEEMKEARKVFSKMSGVPVIGKIFSALIALGNYESIAAFKKSEHYNNLKDWNFAVDFKKKSLSVTPNDEQIAKIKNILTIIGSVIALVVILRKLFCRRK